MKALGWTFIIIHFLLYPASNGYNSYFDKDEKSIGVLKNPPPVDKGLYFLSLILDVIAVILGYAFINLDFAIMLFIYGAVSKSYSHPAIRIKKYAITGWLITGIFQGLFTFVMCYIGVNKYSFANISKSTLLLGGLLTSLMLWANYPMTQVYQHEEDAKRGDITLSILLGVRGTFMFTAGFFFLAIIGFVIYFKTFFAMKYSLYFLAAVLPVVLYFMMWFVQVLRNDAKADYSHTMWLNLISATCLNVFFVYLFLDSSQMLQAFQ
jgi:hypothetical protein